MDEEAKTALDLTSERLQAMRDAGQPGVVAKRPRDLNRSAAEIVRESTERHEAALVGLRPTLDASSVVVTQASFGGYGTSFVVLSESSARTTTILAG